MVVSLETVMVAGSPPVMDRTLIYMSTAAAFDSENRILSNQTQTAQIVTRAVSSRFGIADNVILFCVRTEVRADLKLAGISI